MWKRIRANLQNWDVQGCFGVEKQNKIKAHPFSTHVIDRNKQNPVWLTYGMRLDVRASH